MIGGLALGLLVVGLATIANRNTNSNHSTSSFGDLPTIPNSNTTSNHIRSSNYNPSNNSERNPPRAPPPTQPLPTQQQQLPACYAAKTNRMQALKGSWVPSSTAPPYWNLSCPLEWSKYSCVHQGALSHAQLAARQEFVPDTCTLQALDVPTFAKRLQNRTVYFVGDSLSRQVMIAMICALNIPKTSIRAAWPQCPRKWPCHDTRNCIECGEHSGFEQLEVDFAGAILKVSLTPPSTPNNGDVIVIQSSAHGDRAANTLALTQEIPRLSANGVHVVWFIAWEPHFETQGGEYSEDVLRKAKDAGTPLGCQAEVPDKQVANELKKALDIAKHLSGVLWLSGTNALGHSKVGGGVGSYGDCMHFCMPGPPDQFARALFSLLMQILDA